jgi:hypothetical protein
MKREMDLEREERMEQEGGEGLGMRETVGRGTAQERDRARVEGEKWRKHGARERCEGGNRGRHGEVREGRGKRWEEIACPPHRAV